MFSAEHEKNAEDRKRGHSPTHEHALPPAHSCGLHGGVSLGNNISKGKATALTAVQLGSCKHQQFSSLAAVFPFILYLFTTLIKDQCGKKG